MPHSDTNKEYEKLKEFKEWITSGFRSHCESSYGRALYAEYIYPYVDEMLQCVEYHLEDLAEQVIQDEELMYDLTEEDLDLLTEIMDEEQSDQ